MLKIKQLPHRHIQFRSDRIDDDPDFASRTHNQVDKKAMREFYETQRIKQLEELRLANEKIAVEANPKLKEIWINSRLHILSAIQACEFYIRQYSD